MNAAEITDKLGLHSLRGRNWCVVAWIMSCIMFYCPTRDLRSHQGLSSASLNLFCAMLQHCRYIQSTCATSGEGLYEGLDWLSANIAKASS